MAPGTGNAITEITVDAKTFAEYNTHRGPTEEQEKTSEHRANGGPDAHPEVQPAGGFHFRPGLAFPRITRTIRDSGE